MSLTIIVGQPGSGKSKAIRDRYLKLGKDAVFLDGHHSAEKVRQIRHEMGFYDHRYLSCSLDCLWPELEKLDEEDEVFIDMPNLPSDTLRQIERLSQERDWHLTLTARSIPTGLDKAEIINL